MANTPMQHCVHPGRHASHSPLRRAVSASATSTIWSSAPSPAGNRRKGISQGYRRVRGISSPPVKRRSLCTRTLLLDLFVKICLLIPRGAGQLPNESGKSRNHAQRTPPKLCALACSVYPMDVSATRRRLRLSYLNRRCSSDGFGQLNSPMHSLLLHQQSVNISG